MNKKEKNIGAIKIGLLGASFMTNNFGVAALACGTVASAYNFDPQARFFILDYGRYPNVWKVLHPGGVATVDFINIRFSKRFYLQNNIAYLLIMAFFLKLLPSGSRLSRFLKRNPALKAICEADILCSIAGGDSFSDIYGLARLIYVSLPQILVLLLGKPLVQLPQTIGPFNRPIGKVIGRYILKRSQKIVARDYHSLDVAKKLLKCDSSRLDFCYDMGFLLEPKLCPERTPHWLTKLDHRSMLVGINVSGLLYMGGYTKDNMFGLKVDYRQLIHKLINYFIHKHDAHVMLVPHVFGADENSESDLVACRSIYSSIKDGKIANLHLIEDEYDHHELKALIGRCDFFIGSRMHACIAALSQCIPAVGLAYSRKFKGVFQSIGVDELVIDLREHDGNSVIALVDGVHKRCAEFVLRLEEKIPVVVSQLNVLFEKLILQAKNHSE